MSVLLGNETGATRAPGSCCQHARNYYGIHGRLTDLPHARMLGEVTTFRLSGACRNSSVMVPALAAASRHQQLWKHGQQQQQQQQQQQLRERKLKALGLRLVHRDAETSPNFCRDDSLPSACRLGVVGLCELDQVC